MEPYKVVKLHNEELYVISVLVYNEQYYFPWKVKYIREKSYPVDNILNAKTFKSEDEANNYIIYMYSQ